MRYIADCFCIIDQHLSSSAGFTDSISPKLNQRKILRLEISLLYRITLLKVSVRCEPLTPRRVSLVSDGHCLGFAFKIAAEPTGNVLAAVGPDDQAAGGKRKTDGKNQSGYGIGDGQLAATW